MILVIAEKSIAGKRIAELLAQSALKAHSTYGVQFFEFQRNGKTHFVLPLKGHVYDVDFPKNYSAWLGTDVRKLVDAVIEYIPTQQGNISVLQDHAREAIDVIIATDSDREGESIGLEAVNALKKIQPKLNVLRANFSAITQEEINEAFSKLSKLDYNLADSADARREIDLIWGAVLTRFLSLVSGRLGQEFLSAGRVQSPTLALIVDREKERLAFKINPYWEIEALFSKNKDPFTALHSKGKFWDKPSAEIVMSKKSTPCTVKEVKKSKRELKRPVPFNTTEFLRSATALGFSASHAMSIAETLYQTGLTSYPRTDNQVYPPSLNLRDILTKIREVAAFKKPCDFFLAQKTLKPSKGKLSQDHPPIHPVDAPKTELSDQQWKIYELISRRFFATLGETAITENMKVDILMKDELFQAFGQRYTHLGWKEFYPYSKAEDVILPELRAGDLVDLTDLQLLAKETKPPARYSQGTLIKTMEELGLGTKATRAEIIQKLYARKYISGKKVLEPNKIAFAVTEVLEKYDKTIVSADMTAELEKEMDLIATGKKTKALVVNESRDFLRSNIETLIVHKNQVGSEIRQALRSDKEFFNCTDSQCTGKLISRKGFTGKRFLGCSQYPKCHTTYPLPQKGTLETLQDMCSTCQKPQIRVKGARYTFTMCINPQCATKADWKKPAVKTAPVKASITPASASKASSVKTPVAKKPKEKNLKKKPAPLKEQKTSTVI